MIDEPVLRSGKLPGMFMDEKDLVAAGFSKCEESPSTFVTIFSAPTVCDWLLEQSIQGKIMVVNYTHMAIGGSEGYVEYWSKE